MTLQSGPHDHMFIRQNKTPERDGRTDRRTDGLGLLQRSALRAMRTRCKNCGTAATYLIIGFCLY